MDTGGVDGPSTGFVDVTSVWHVLGTGVARALLTRAGKDDALDLGSGEENIRERRLESSWYGSGIAVVRSINSMRVSILKLSPDFLDCTVLTEMELVVCFHDIADGQDFTTSDVRVCTEFGTVVVGVICFRRSVFAVAGVRNRSLEATGVNVSPVSSCHVILIDDDAVDMLGAISAGVRRSTCSERVAAVHSGNVMREGDGDGVNSVPEVGISLIRLGGALGFLETVAELVEGSDIESEVGTELVVREGGDSNTGSSSSSISKSGSS